MRAEFGPAGTPDEFFELGYKSTVQIPAYLHHLGLRAFEYQCGRGVNVGEKAARQFGEQAQAHSIAVSLHAPYYISLSSPDPSKREKSMDYLLQSARALDWMGGRRVVLHCGGTVGAQREQAFELALETLTNARTLLDEAGYAHIILCPEVMGKHNQLGTLEEVLTLCAIGDNMLPCIDFGHLNARTGGGLQTFEDYYRALQAVEDALGVERAQTFHAHFSKIEYTAKGEKKHLDFDSDPGFGPDFEPLAQVLHTLDAAPTVICESASKRATDALAMQRSLLALYDGAERQ